MSPLSTSNSNDVRGTFPRPTRSLCLAVVVLLLARTALSFVNQDHVAPIDSRRVQAMLLNDLQCEARVDSPPQVVVLGTSRTILLNKNRLAQQLGVPQDAVVNLSSLGADFFYMETVLRRHPDILRNAKVVVFDVMPMQAMNNHNYNERGEFFVRFASLQQRLNARGVVSKAASLGELVLPVKSFAQDPSEWRGAFCRVDMNADQFRNYLTGIPLDRFGDWTTTTERIADAERAGKGMQEFTELFFVGPDVMPNQVNALQHLIDMTPKDCTVIPAWLPFRGDVMAYVAQSQDKRESRDQLKQLLEGIDDPRVELQWYDKPQDIGLTPNDYENDGAHFQPTGVTRLTELYADLIRPHL